MEVIEYITKIGGCASAVIAIVGAVAFVVKPVRKQLAKLIDRGELEKKIDAIGERLDKYVDSDREITLCQLRHTILEIYYTYAGDEYIPHYVKANLVELYDAYKKMGGNHYIEKLYKELMDKPEKI